ncbi:DUF4870 domain-containing protein [Isoptericola sp. NEAU-Y5]|uniref:DUF4870 domain-containing protein n=1 Tax=Isoptericola luteus TaxID=2879484 RepID=A0ABS7ZK26_9MICO|nr:DUF4870 domain-containing protein [Isoptericola sp. NEAU-Y5]MCA5894877.1 DUF4870 domain-containing protein [Isoptericola sp. NEAU-Y5]
MSQPPEGTPPQQPPYGEQPPHGGQPPYGEQPPSGGQPPYPPPPGGQQPYPQAYGAQPLAPADERMWAIVAHLGAPVGALVSAGVLGFLAPLVVWLVLRERSAYVADQAKEALNFQITLLIGYVVSIVLMFVVIGFFTATAIWVMSIVFGILAAVAANRHEWYRYPLTIRFIS